MPKLSQKAAKAVEDHAGEGFELLDNGAYHVRLREVTVSENPGPSGSHYWTWVYDVVEEPYVNRRLFNNTSLSDNAAFKLKECFDAFGVGIDTDTDELCGQVCKAVVGTRVIQSGARKGETANQIERLSLADEDFEAPDKEKEEEDLF